MCARKTSRSCETLTMQRLYLDPIKPTFFFGKSIQEYHNKEPYKKACPGRFVRVRLGGSWVVVSRVISRVTILITHISGLIAPLITTPPYNPTIP